MEYLTKLRSDIRDYLVDKIGSDHFVEEFWSDDVIEAAAYLGGRRNRLSQSPFVLVTVPSIITDATRSAPTDILDAVDVLCWIAARDTHDENRQVREASRAMVLTQAYLSQTRFGTSFSSEETINGWQKSIEFEDDEHVIYALRGTLDLEIDLQSVIDDYES